MEWIGMNGNSPPWSVHSTGDFMAFTAVALQRCGLGKRRGRLSIGCPNPDVQRFKNHSFPRVPVCGQMDECANYPMEWTDSLVHHCHLVGQIWIDLILVLERIGQHGLIISGLLCPAKDVHLSRAGWDRRVCRLWTKQSRWTFVKHFSSSLTWRQSWGSRCSSYHKTWVGIWPSSCVEKYELHVQLCIHR